MTKNIEVLYADSGGGHRSVARAICAAIQATGADCTVRLVNATEISRPLFDGFATFYPLFIRHAPWLYHLFYRITDNPFFARTLEYLLGLIFGRAVRRYLAHRNVDLLISCHILITLLLPQAHGKAKLVSITADPFSPHADSFSPRMDLCVVSSSAAREIALRQGVLPEKISVAAHPVLPDYLSATLGKRETLARLGLTDGALTILITGGGDGLGKMLQVINQLDASGLPIQLVIVCGRNQKLYAELKTRNFHLPVSVIPFTEEMPSLLCAADVLVTKAGPSALFEAFQAGLPIVIFDAIMGQEAGNVAYVCDHGAGLFCKSPASVVDALRRLIDDPDLRQRMSACSLALARPNAALDVARVCLSLLENAQS